MAGVEGRPSFDHVVSVTFENRSFDNLLGRLHQPDEMASFEGVTLPPWLSRSITTVSSTRIVDIF